MPLDDSYTVYSNLIGFYISFHLIGYNRMSLPQYPETGRSSPPSYYLCGVSPQLVEIDSKLMMEFGWGSNPRPPSPKANTLAQKLRYIYIYYSDKYHYIASVHLSPERQSLYQS